MNKNELKELYPQMSEQFMETVNKSVSEGLKDSGKVIRMKKKIFLVLAATVAMAVTAIGAGKAGMITVSSNEMSKFTDADKIAEIGEDIGLDVKYVEEFDNGYTFDYGYTSVNKEKDGNGEMLGEWESLHMRYSLNGDEMTYIAEKYRENDDAEEGEISTHTDAYKFIPEGYEMTEQDKADMESGKYIFSTGDRDMPVSVYDFTFAVWHEDGIRYTLMQYSDRGSLSEEEIRQMAEEIIAAE